MLDRSVKHIYLQKSVKRIKPQTVSQWIAAGDKLLKDHAPARAVTCFIKVNLLP